MGEPFDNPSASPYILVHDQLKNDIIQKKLKEGEQLPSEDELAKKFRISRMTLRKSLSLLINEGYIYSQHGVGTFVSKLPIQFDYTKIISFSAWVKAQGHRHEAKILSVSEIAYDEEIYEGLNVKKHQGVICINRLRKVDDLPVAMEHSYHPKDHYQNYQINDLEVDLQSLFIVMEKSGYHATREFDIVSATNATQDQADILEVTKGDALLFFKTITYSKQGFPIEFLRMVARPDRFQFTFVLPRYHSVRR